MVEETYDLSKGFVEGVGIVLRTLKFEARNPKFETKR